MSDSLNKDGIDDYNNHAWTRLGHPAFDDDYLIDMEDLEWWDVEDEKQA